MSAEIAVAFPRGVFGRVLPALTGAALRPLQALLSTPQWIFLAALTAMLFRPPDLQGFPADRIAFAVLLVAVALRLCVQRQSLHYYPATWPALALTCLGLLSVLGQPYAPEAWSVLAAKWLVPSALFHISGYVFRDAGALRKLETFLLVVLVYLALVSVVFLLGATSWVFPRYILDEGIGIHADRARGPFLQAVANGVSLNLLGILALDGFRRGRVRGLLAAFLFLLVPLALLATKTRAVWASAALSIGYLLFFGPHRKLRRAAAAFCALALLSASAALVNEVNSGTLAER
ncbi:MAG TPA: hypothetical protein VFB00_06155, partial [Terriglobales bacterium]|nr:hypothetical protein [Terriglobales bacterium]